MTEDPSATGSAAVDPVAFGERISAQLRALAASLGPLEPVARGLIDRPGKRMRSLMLAHCASLGRPRTDDVVRAAAVVELLQIASLLHDDVVDQSPTRRFAPAAHVAHGSELALLGGVACFGLAGTEAAELGPTSNVLTSRAVAELARGEMLDVERAFDVALDVDDYVALVAAKTAALFRLSCELGAEQGRCDAATRQALATFGSELGIGFQILDDCLDLEGAGSGKPVGRDLALGLYGAPLLCALAAAGDDDDRELAGVLRSPSFGDDDLPRVHALVLRHDGIAAARRMAAERIARALAALDEIAPGPGRDGLETIARPLTEDPR
ncbi:polyprenyl synthetase family protein [Patulibacter defluvii]|uniref:polyprenyl synthetase family protein n=1 Tax=Patulibacter defluvii TaxID=3095358 RepID=UPI002A761B3F|nr:polyprenyl synthetase family protein [Patulibacter sp. DM4]